MNTYSKQEAMEYFGECNLKLEELDDATKWWINDDTGEMLLQAPALFNIKTYGLSEPVNLNVLGHGHKDVAEKWFETTRQGSPISFERIGTSTHADFSTTDRNDTTRFYSITGEL